MSERAAIILAAGQGTRMKSDLPKVLHQIGGRAMVDWSISLAEEAGCGRILVVINPSQTDLRAHIETRLGAAAVVEQAEALGTGHAVRCAEPSLADFDGDVVVLYADTPLIPGAAVEQLFGKLSEGATLGVLGFEAERPGAYGRLVLGPDGSLEEIVEAKDATPEQLGITFCNSGVLAGRRATLFELLSRVTNDNAKGEFYLTDTVRLARRQQQRCEAVSCHEQDVLGVNSRAELAAAEHAFQAAKRQAVMESGVTLVAPDTVFFSFDTSLDRDVIVEPNVVFGPGVRVAEGARVRAFSHLEGAEVGPRCEVGPYARLRPGAVLEAEAKIGNFVEVKKTRIGEGAKANHLAYLGDGDVGAGANIGAGTIFCNYDGFFKYETRIGPGAFIGSNSALVAPVTIGEGAYIGSGSTVTRDVSAEALSLARAQQVEKPGWATTFRNRMTERKKNKSAGKNEEA